MSATIQLTPTNLALTGVAGDPFTLYLATSFTDASGDALSASVASNPAVQVVNSFYVSQPTCLPTVSTSGSVFTVSWSAAQTQRIADLGVGSWGFAIDINGVGPLSLVAGRVVMTPSTFPGSSNSTSATLTVSVGTVTADVAVTVAGSGGGSNDSYFQGVYTNSDGAPSAGPYVDGDYYIWVIDGAPQGLLVYGALIDAFLNIPSSALLNSPTTPYFVPWQNAIQIANISDDLSLPGGENYFLGEASNIVSLGYTFGVSEGAPVYTINGVGAGTTWPFTSGGQVIVLPDSNTITPEGWIGYFINNTGEDCFVATQLGQTISGLSASVTVPNNSVFGVIADTSGNYQIRGGGPAINDVTFVSNTVGPVLVDQSNGHTYRIIVTNGVLGVHEVT